MKLILYGLSGCALFMLAIALYVASQLLMGA